MCGANLEVKSNCSFQPLLPASQALRGECVDAGLPRCKPQLRSHILLDGAASQPAENPLGSPFSLPFPSARPHIAVLTGEHAGAHCFKWCTGILQRWVMSFFLRLIHQEKLFLIESYFSKKSPLPWFIPKTCSSSTLKHIFYLYLKQPRSTGDVSLPLHSGFPVLHGAFPAGSSRRDKLLGRKIFNSMSRSIRASGHRVPISPAPSGREQRDSRCVRKRNKHNDLTGRRGHRACTAIFLARSLLVSPK